jgi:hypothetical protein
MDIVVSIKPVLNGVFKFLIYKTFLNYKIDCIYGSFKKKTSETVFVLKQRLYFKIIFPNIPDE